MKSILPTALKSFILILLAICSLSALAQTNPAVINLFPLNYSLTSLTPSGSTYPTGMQGWMTGTNNLVGITGAPATGDIPLTPNGSATTPGISNLGTLGFCFLASTGGANAQVGELAVSLKTIGRTNIVVGWTAFDPTSGPARQMNLALQYRIGNSGSFTTLPGSTYTTSNAGTTSSLIFPGVLLPAVCEDQALVQVRWIYYESPGQSGTPDGICLDDISISSHANTQVSLEITGTLVHDSTCPGTLANAIQYRVTNYGGYTAQSLAVSSTNSTEFPITVPLSATTISSLGGSATFSVRFNPATAGTKTSTLSATATSPGGSNNPSIVISGTGFTSLNPAAQTNAASNILNTKATLNGNLLFAGRCQLAAEKGFVYAQTADNADPLVGGTGVTKVVVAGATTGSYFSDLTGLNASTAYSFKAYAYDGTAYTYGTTENFNTLAAATTLAFSIQPPTTAVAHATLSSFSVQARRPDNSVDLEYTGMITLSRNIISGSGNLTGTISMAAVAGQADFDNVQFDTPGEYTITASSGTLAAVTSAASSTVTGGTLPLVFQNLNASRQNNNILLSWKISNQLNIIEYEVQRSRDGINFTRLTSLPVLAGSEVIYQWNDINPLPAGNYYRIRSLGLANEIRYSIIVYVSNTADNVSFGIYPNPVKGPVLNFQSCLPVKANAQFRIINNGGKIVFTSPLLISQGSSSNSVSLPGDMPAGMYFAELVVPGSKTLQQKILILPE